MIASAEATIDVLMFTPEQSHSHQRKELWLHVYKTTLQHSPFLHRANEEAREALDHFDAAFPTFDAVPERQRNTEPAV